MLHRRDDVFQAELLAVLVEHPLVAGLDPDLQARHPGLDQHVDHVGVAMEDLGAALAEEDEVPPGVGAILLEPAADLADPVVVDGEDVVGDVEALDVVLLEARGDLGHHVGGAAEPERPFVDLLEAESALVGTASAGRDVEPVADPQQVLVRERQLVQVPDGLPPGVGPHDLADFVGQRVDRLQAALPAHEVLSEIPHHELALSADGEVEAGGREEPLGVDVGQGATQDHAALGVPGLHPGGVALDGLDVVREGVEADQGGAGALDEALQGGRGQAEEVGGGHAPDPEAGVPTDRGDRQEPGVEERVVQAVEAVDVDEQHVQPVVLATGDLLEDLLNLHGGLDSREMP